MKTTRYRKAFTLVELLITMVVTGIILLAVTTLAFAMSSASRSSDDTLVQEAQLRQARLRITELVRTCKLICAAPGTDLALWQDDANDDGLINVSELVYIERGDALSTLRLCQFSPGQNDEVTLPSLAVATMKAFLVSKYSEVYVRLIPVCQNVQFSLDTAPPFTRQLTISFGLNAGGVTHPYEINVALRAWAGHLLSSDGTTLASDDD